MSFPFADQTQKTRVERLIFDLTEFMKPPNQRHPDIQQAVQPYTKFNMNRVYSGKQTLDGTWRVDCVHLVGLAALDPWFQARGIRPSVIPLPPDFDTLDIGGVMVLNPHGCWRRVGLDDIYLREYFGIGPVCWENLVDSETYPNGILQIRPQTVLHRLYEITARTHGTPDPTQGLDRQIPFLESVVSLHPPEPFS